MSPHPSPGHPDQNRQGGSDPWVAFGYLVAGVGCYGVLGWLLGRWLSVSYLTPIGIVLGAGFGLYLVFHRYAGVSASHGTTSAPPRPFRNSDSTDAAGPTSDDER
jgi:hypothetical protein